MQLASSDMIWKVRSLLVQSMWPPFTALVRVVDHDEEAGRNLADVPLVLSKHAGKTGLGWEIGGVKGIRHTDG